MGVNFDQPERQSEQQRGPRGPTGQTGASLRSGFSAPGTSVGNVGDFFLEVNGGTGSRKLYGPKEEGGWQAPILLGIPEGDFSDILAAVEAGTVAVEEAVELVAAKLDADGGNIGGNAAALRGSLDLGNAATRDVGTVADTVAAGNDSRLTNAARRDGAGMTEFEGASFALNAGLVRKTGLGLDEDFNPAFREALGLGDAATRDIGTAAGTAAAGNDARIVGAAQASANLSDLADIATALTNLGAASDDLLNVTDEGVTDRIVDAERARGAGFYNVIRLTENDLDTTGAFNMQPALQAFINLAQAQDKWLVLPGGYSVIRLDSSLVANHGKAADLDATQRFRMDGNGSILRPQMADFALKINPLCDIADVGTGWAVADLGIEDIWFELADNAGAKALLLGAFGKVLDGFKYEDLVGLLVTGASVSGTIELRGTVRQLEMVDIVQRDDGGLLFDSDFFVGDIQARSLQLSGTTAARPLIIRTSAALAAVRGLSLSGDVYGAGSLITAAVASQLGDFWFTDFQFEAPRGGVLPALDEVGLEMFGASGSQLFDIFFQNTYWKGYRGRSLLYQLSGGSGTNIQINGGITSEIEIDDPNAGAILCVGASGLHVNNHQFRDIDSLYAANFISCTDMSVVDCRLSRRAGSVATPPTGLIAVGGAGMDKYTIRGNRGEIASGLDSDMVNDYSTGTVARVVRDNKTDDFSGTNAIIPTIPSSATPTLPLDGDTFYISGTTSFGQLAGGFKDRKVLLIFLDALSVFSSTPDFNDMRLAGGATFNAVAGSTLELTHSGVQWFQSGGVA